MVFGFGFWFWFLILVVGFGFGFWFAVHLVPAGANANANPNANGNGTGPRGADLKMGLHTQKRHQYTEGVAPTQETRLPILKSLALDQTSWQNLGSKVCPPGLQHLTFWTHFWSF